MEKTESGEASPEIYDLLNNSNYPEISVKPEEQTSVNTIQIVLLTLLLLVLLLRLLKRDFTNNVAGRNIIYSPPNRLLSTV